jgi:O-antigen/teichoic acid export membrane protein
VDSSIKKIFQASGAAAFGQVLNIANQLLLVPIYMKFWGAHLFGEWLILSAAPSVIAMAGDLGFGTVAANEMNLNVAKNNKTEALRVFQNSWIVISSFSILFFIVCFGIIGMSPLNNILNIKTIAESESKLILLMFLANLIMLQQNQLLLAALRSEGNYVAGMIIQNIAKLCELLAIVISISFFAANPVTIVSIILTLQVLTFVVLKITLSQKSPWVKYGIEHRSLAVIKKQVPLALSFISFPITQAFSIQGAVIIVGSILGPTAVVLFSTVRTFMNVIKQVVSIINASIWPELTTAYGQEDYKKFQKIFVASLQILALIVISFNIFMLVAGKPIYLWWTKHKIDVSNSFFYTFAVITSISAIWNLFGIVQAATNKAKKYAFYNLVSIAILIGCITVLSRFIGINGVLFALMFSEVFMLLFVIRDAFGILEYNSLGAFKTQLFTLKLNELKFFSKGA